MFQNLLKKGDTICLICYGCVKGRVFEVDVYVYTDNRHINIMITSWLKLVILEKCTNE